MGLDKAGQPVPVQDADTVPAHSGRGNKAEGDKKADPEPFTKEFDVSIDPPGSW